MIIARCCTYIITPSIKPSFEVDQKILSFFEKETRLEGFSYLPSVTLQGSARTSWNPEPALPTVSWSVIDGGGSDKNR